MRELIGGEDSDSESDDSDYTDESVSLFTYSILEGSSKKSNYNLKYKYVLGKILLKQTKNFQTNTEQTHYFYII